MQVLKIGRCLCGQPKANWSSRRGGDVDTEDVDTEDVDTEDVDLKYVSLGLVDPE